jgi:predicted component of type VI protein secretion system
MRSYRIGRADTNDIVLADSTVSREHAELAELGGGRFRIKDLGSTFGLAIRQGQDWEKVTEAELGHDAALRIGEFETTVAELLRDSDKTVVRAKASAPRTAPAETAPPPAPKAPPPERAAPPAKGTPSAAEASAPSSEATSPPLRPPPTPAPSAPPKPVPPKPAPPRPAPPRPAPPRAPAQAGDAASASDGSTPPQPAPPAFQFLRNLPPEKRILVWLGAGFAAFLFIALITLILALVL